jgi:hypothetical protein
MHSELLNDAHELEGIGIGFDKANRAGIAGGGRGVLSHGPKWRCQAESGPAWYGRAGTNSLQGKLCEIAAEIEDPTIRDPEFASCRGEDLARCYTRDVRASIMQVMHMVNPEIHAIIAASGLARANPRLRPR